MSNRILKDADLIKEKALPAAGASAYTDGIDLGQDVLGADGDRIEAEIAVPATPNLVAGSITAQLQDSADNATFANIAGLGAITVTGGAGGGAATTSQLRLPRATRRYVRAAFAVSADGGDNTGVDGSLSLLF